MRIISLQVLLKPGLAELLFPHLLLDIAAYDQDVALCPIISAQVKRHVFTKPYPQTRVVSLFLSCLNQLRNFHLESLDASKRKAKDESSELLSHFSASGGEAWHTVGSSRLSHAKPCRHFLQRAFLHV